MALSIFPSPCGGPPYDTNHPLDHALFAAGLYSLHARSVYRLSEPTETCLVGLFCLWAAGSLPHFGASSCYLDAAGSTPRCVAIQLFSYHNQMISGKLLLQGELELFHSRFGGMVL